MNYDKLFDLSGELVLLTGGYGHLGQAMVRGLLAHNARVVVLGRSEDKFRAAFQAELAAAEAAATGPAASGRLHFVACDVASTASVRTALAESRAQHGLPTALVNNAFYSQGQQPDALTDDDFARGFDGSVGAAYRCLREVLPYLREGGRGRIVNVASMYGLVAPDFAAYTDAPQFLNPPHYGAGKAAMVQLTRYFASYLGPENIQVNALSPGAFPSPAVQQNAGFVAELNRRSPLGRIGQPAELAAPTVFLLSPAAGFLTGHNLVVDGGWTIR